MDPIRTPDYASASMEEARRISDAHREEILRKDRGESRAFGEWHFRRAGWDPCYDVSVDSALRGAEFAMVAKTEALYRKKEEKDTDYTSSSPNKILTNAHSSAKIQPKT